MPVITLIEGVNMALAHEMRRDPDVLLLGEDIGVSGGVFRATINLLEKFGSERVIDTPLAESMIAGISVGMASQGLRPVAEIQFMGFIFPAINQLATAAARLRNRSRGRISVPLVVRAPYGGGIHAPEHHSESTEAIFAHLPGLKVVIPSTPARAYGLLLASIRDPDPVIFLEPKRIYRRVKENVEDNGKALPLETCFIDREGSDITLISWGAMLYETRQAAEKLAQEGISCEVIDIACLTPLDSETLIKSVEKTGRCVIIQEAPRTCGFASEVAAVLAEKALLSLIAPIHRVTGYDTVMPYSQTEHRYMPSVDRIVDQVQESLRFT